MMETIDDVPEFINKMYGKAFDNKCGYAYPASIDGASFLVIRIPYPAVDIGDLIDSIRDGY